MLFLEIFFVKGEAKRFGLKKQLGKGKARKLLVNIHRYRRDGKINCIGNDYELRFAF